MAIARSTSAAPKGNAFVGTEGIYNLPHHKREIDRLQRQHNFILSSTGGLLLGMPVETNATLRILDAGAADGTWLRSLAQHYPNQKWSLHGIDIGSALFPPPSADGPIVDLQKHDIRKPIPKHLHLPESFDIVHQRYLIWGLKSSEWPQAVGNLRSVLKPGGWIQLVEAQWVDRDTPFDPVKFPTLAKMTEFQRWSTAAFGMNAYIAYELEDLLSDLGFRNIKKTSFALGYGAMAREEQWKVTSAHILVEGFRSLGHKMPPGGIPGVARTPAEYDAFLDELRDDVMKHGYAPQLNIVIGQKPSERALASL
ncbi:methyltransferase family protein [Aspergillus piperis CBS 112811]|uniref:Methyltransferase family protein n=1 Tax=Aspergillus piperis CBS 112811 TaxID=1448313 RepID=A0A8G1VUG1_9EURO|nr:methyltransferase family protein [Aspergillus piperis CBS 112811]RAH62813.1 methyltransferase family protein [Aspergillus piperis CBS 112811]